MYEYSSSCRESAIAHTLRGFDLELSSSVKEQDEFECLMHGHLRCLVAWHQQIGDDSLDGSKGPSPKAPLTLLDCIVDALPTEDGLRVF
jgi:hypothetical protein